MNFCTGQLPGRAERPYNSILGPEKGRFLAYLLRPNSTSYGCSCSWGAFIRLLITSAGPQARLAHVDLKWGANFLPLMPSFADAF